jgi:hypothetical protein
VRIEWLVWFHYVGVTAIVAVTRTMANVPTTEFQKIWSILINSLKLEYEDTIQQHLDADAIMERVRGVPSAIARIASVSGSPKWALIVQNVGCTRRNLHQVLKGKQLYSALCGVYTEVLHGLTAVLKEGAAKGKEPRCTSVHRGIPPAKKTHRRHR